MSFGVCTRLLGAEKHAGRSLRVMDEVQALGIDICQVRSFWEVCNNPAGLWVIDLDWGEGAAFVQRFHDQQSCDESFLSTPRGGEDLLTLIQFGDKC